MEWPISEVKGWFEYFKRRPIGWRDDHRFSYLLAAWGVKEKPHKLFASLHTIERERQLREERDHSSDASKLVGSGFLHKMIKDTGWDVNVKE